MLTGFLITLGVLLAVALAPVLIPLAWALLVLTFGLVAIVIGFMLDLITYPFRLLKALIKK